MFMQYLVYFMLIVNEKFIQYLNFILFQLWNK